jgi:hypothetical protein
MFLPTLLLSILMDQTKSVGLVMILYIVIVRRFGFLQSNEKEYLT